MEAGFVVSAEEYLYISAMNYAGRPEVLLDVMVAVSRGRLGECPSGSFGSLETAGMICHKCPETEHLRQRGAKWLKICFPDFITLTLVN